MSIQTWARWYSTLYSGGYSLPQQLVSGFPCRSVGKESTYNAGDLGLIPGSGRSPGEGNGNPLQYSCLQNPMDRRAWRATVHGAQESDMAERPDCHCHCSAMRMSLDSETDTGDIQEKSDLPK